MQQTLRYGRATTQMLLIFSNFLYDASLPANSIIEADPGCISNGWKHPRFDLWEEAQGLHFFTWMVQLRALSEGKEVPSSCTQPSSDEVLLSLLELVEDQRGRFPTNTKLPSSGNVLEGVGIGHYPEDVYDGGNVSRGNPWFLCTASASEILYRSLAHAAQQEFLRASGRDLCFWAVVSPGQIMVPGNYTIRGPVSNNTLIILKRLGEGFLKVIERHADALGNLSEQFDGIAWGW